MEHRYGGVSKSFQAVGGRTFGGQSHETCVLLHRSHGQVDVDESNGVDVVAYEARHLDWLFGDSFSRDPNRIQD